MGKGPFNTEERAKRVSYKHSLSMHWFNCLPGTLPTQHWSLRAEVSSLHNLAACMLHTHMHEQRSARAQQRTQHERNKNAGIAQCRAAQHLCTAVDIVSVMVQAARVWQFLQ
jgi:hypothetical protein